MKNITKFLLILLVSSLSFQSYAQTFGIRGGLSMANMLDKDEDGTYSGDYQMNPGFHAGVTIDYPFSEMVSFETGLFLNTKGFKITEEEDGFDVTAKSKLYYADIPLTLKVLGEVSEGVKVFVSAGPYIGIGISGKVTADASVEGYDVSVDEDIDWGSGEDDDLKRLDYGITAGAGIEFNRVLVGLFYDYGLANVSAYTGDGTVASHRVLKFSLGLKF